MVGHSSADMQGSLVSGDASAGRPAESGRGAGGDSLSSRGTVALWQLPVIWNIPVEEDIRFLMRGVASDVRKEPEPIPVEQMDKIVAFGLLDLGYYVGQQHVDVGTDGDAIERFRVHDCHGNFRPNFAFDNLWYRTKYQDVAESGVSPLLHYFLYGEKEWRRPILWFDTAWYVAEYGAAIDGAGPLVHYLRNRKLGCFSPNSLFDCSYYLDCNRNEVESLGGDPFEHFLLYGHKQGRNPSPKFNIEQYRVAKLSGRPEINPLLHALAGMVGYKIEPVDGFPVPESPSSQEIAEEASIVAVTIPAEPVDSPVDVAPVVNGKPTGSLVLAKRVENELDVAALASLARQRVGLAYDEISRDADKLVEIVAEARDESNAASLAGNYEGDLEAAASEFDFHFYLSEYPQVREQGLDPLLHYFETGWEMGYDPSPWFSTRYYLDSNSDIAKANVNPFWHFIVAGRKEGRLPKLSSGLRRTMLSNLKTPDEKTADYCVPDHERLTKSQIVAAFASASAKADGAVLSISHDCYPLVVGGTQIFIADEQRKFNERKYVYFHLSPLLGALRMRKDAADEAVLRLVVDGRVVGAGTAVEFADAISEALGDFAGPKIFAVHCALGHSTDALLAVRDSFRPTDSFYWLHDYSSLCTGLNLLRNDIDYCGAPPEGAMACNVCIYGESRKEHMREIARLFEACEFKVVSPSDAAREIWLESSHLPHKGVLTVAHSLIETTGVWRDTRPSQLIGRPQHPVRVAFMGYRSVAKGSGAFERIVHESCGVAAYEFYHFASPGVEPSSARVKKVDVSVTAQDRDAMVRALTENDIDIVVIASIWPETFSYTLFESLAAGCDIVTVADSGNVAAKVQETGRGLVFPDEDALVEFFVKGGAVAWTRARSREGISRGALRQTGTTVAVLFDHL